MAHPSSSVGTLRALTYRITSTPPQELPPVAPQIASSIWTCRSLLSASTETKQNSEAALLVHKFKTQLTSLLSSRAVESRWSAVVLTKATIEAGGVETLSKCNPWVKALLQILKKPDPPTTRCLTVLTLTRIFMLSWDYSNLAREITTPALKGFVPSCLANVERKGCSASELLTVLEAFAVLLPRHPTIFRENDVKLRAILSAILSSGSSPSENGLHSTAQHKEVANRLWVLMANCTPKQGAAGKWDETLSSAIKATHSTCDRVFRSVVEDWQSTTGVQPSVPVHQLNNGEVEFESEDAAGLKPWKGVYAGGDRIMSLLAVITSHLETATPGSVNIRIGAIADVLARLFANVLPQAGKQDYVKPNNHISKDEREAMYAVLPKIHISAMRLSTTLLERLNQHAMGWAQTLVDQTLRVFAAEHSHPELRSAAYDLLEKILDLIGPTLSKTEASELTSMLKFACQDLLPDDSAATPATSSTPSTTQPAGIKQQLGLSGAQNAQSHPPTFPLLTSAAKHLLTTTLTRLDATAIPAKLRAQIDRTAVLTQNKDLLLASALNPDRKVGSKRVQASLLPMLARLYPEAAETEALLRPRLPPLRTAAKSSYDDEDEDDEDEEMEAEGEDDEVMNDGEEQQEDETNGPTASLLSAPADQPVRQTPKFAYEPPTVTTANKRPAAEHAENAEGSSKRARAASPVVDAGAVLKEITDLATTVVMDSATPGTSSAAEQQSRVLPAREVVPPAVTGQGMGEEDSDSDIEIPTINMEESDEE